ncbi:hypothetical protein Hanom_Chr08g00718121 [Helianthus anomalus]
MTATRNIQSTKARNTYFMFFKRNEMNYTGRASTEVVVCAELSDAGRFDKMRG